MSRRRFTREVTGLKYDQKALDEFLASVASRCKDYTSLRSFPTGNAAARRAAIDEHIKQLEDVLVEVKNALNKSLENLASLQKPAFANRLEDEVLLRIFKYAGERGADVRTTRTILHTCSQWRRLVLSAPTMWSSMDCTSMSPSLLMNYTQLSGSHPLDVQVSLSNTVHRTACEGLLPRMKSLVLRQCTPASIKSNIWLFQKPAVNLERMTIRCGSGGTPKTWPHMLNWEDGYELADTLFLGDHPKLLDLELIGCRLPWHPGMYNNLTRLTLSLGRAEVTNPDRKYNIIYVFHDSPNLEESTLHGPEQIPITPLGPADPLVPMRRLRHLQLSLSSKDTYAILSSIATPLDLRLTLNCIIVRGTPTHQRCIKLPKDIRCLPCLERIQKLEFDAPGNRILAFAMGPDEEDVPVLTASIVTDQDLISETAITASFAMMRGLPLYGLHDLTIRESLVASFESEDVAMFFWDTAKDIRRFTLAACTPAALSKIVEHYKNQVRPYCPSLLSMHLSEMRIGSGELFDACEVLARADRTLSLDKVNLDPGELSVHCVADAARGGVKSMHNAAVVLARIRRLKFAKVSITEPTWGTLRRPLPFNYDCT